MSAARVRLRPVVCVWAICLLSACGSRPMLLEVSGTIMYEKPRITQVSHTLTDSRAKGGGVAVRVFMSGDPGLGASFDIHPDIAERQPMKEVEDGEYVGEFHFPDDVVGGPFTIVVRLRHEASGEVTLRDPDLITVPLAAEMP